MVVLETGQSIIIWKKSPRSLAFLAVDYFLVPQELDLSSFWRRPERTRKAGAPPSLNYDGIPLIPLNDTIKSKEKGKLDEDPNITNNEALVLFTSGTTGNKKLVPHQIGNLLMAATVIALSWHLQPHDGNCNLMPLFHVGGII